MLNKEGLGTVVGTILLALVVGVGAIMTSHLHLQVMALLCVLLALLVVYFFRDPERNIPDNTAYVLSPADGKIVEIVEENEPEFLKEKRFFWYLILVFGAKCWYFCQLYCNKDLTGIEIRKGYADRNRKNSNPDGGV